MDISKISAALERFREGFCAPTRLSESLPLVQEFCQRRLSERTFADLDVLFIQHHLGPFVPRLRSMIASGLDPASCWFVDIPYSWHPKVREGLLALGCRKEQMAIPLRDPLVPYAEVQHRRVEDLILELAHRPSGRRLLVVDDGAYFVRVLNRRKDLLKRFTGRTRVVEQTTRGQRYLKSLRSIPFPVVSVARCETKRKLESPFIGAAVARALRDSISADDRLADKLRRVAVIGFGPVGEAVTFALMQLRKQARLPVDVPPIDVVDIASSKATSICEIGARPLTRLPNRGSYTLVVGCTGYASFHVRHLALLADEAVLASGSSAAVEFNRKDFLERADKPRSRISCILNRRQISILNRQEIRKDRFHATFRMSDGKRTFSFLNAGFPINFDGQLECLPPWAIQATHALLVAASQETLGLSRPQFRSLNRNDDCWILKRGLELL